MNFFSHGSIKRKLMAIIMVVSSVALLLACAAIMIFEANGFKNILKRNTQVMAEVIGANSSGALSFSDKVVGRETLSALRAEPYVLSACLYKSDGQVLATYYRDNAAQHVPPPPREDSFSFEKDALQLFHTIRYDGDVIGTVLIRSDLSVLRSRIRMYAGITAAVMLSAFLIAFILSLRLQRVISSPISHLADTANQVAHEKNYSVRARKSSDDEMGQLIDRFNEMLAGIQERDAALLQAQDDLERRVDERTKELQLEISERSRVEKELRDSQQKFETLVNSIGGVVWEADPRTFEFKFVSEQAEKFLGFPRTEWTDDAGFWLDHIYNDDQVLAHGLRMKALQQERSAEIEYRMVASDGRIVWVREISTFIIEAGVPQALRGVLFDITEQKQAEEELEVLNKRLVESSRQAGMAEVATGVLHNVGNVLNSVNVSTNVLADKLRLSKVQNLGKAIELIRDNQTRLGDFLCSDERGKQLPAYLSRLSEYMTREHESMLGEIQTLTKSVDHIKQIVAAQQSYAKVTTANAHFDITSAMEDALNINSHKLIKSHVLVEKNYALTKPVFADRHLVMQILINLISNAEQAMRSTPENRRTLRVSVVEAATGDKAMVSVQDSGCGIEAETTTRIFQFGFTTRPEGHGFGLHASANAAKQMRGSLVAHSDGKGAGAVFTLELPLQPAEVST